MLSLFRGDPCIRKYPKAISHPGVFFYPMADKVLTKGYIRSIRKPEMVGAVRELIVPMSVINALAPITDDVIYASILGPEDDFNTSLDSRGSMPSEEMANNLRKAGYIGFIKKTGKTEIFLLPEIAASYFYEPLS